MASDKRLGKRLPEWVRREDAPGVRVDSGPFIGIVKNNIDSTRSGRLQVWISDLGGDENDPKSWRTVNYASPFLGSTYKVPGNNSKNNKFDSVAHTYGMWAVPPDLDNEVICTFISGMPDKGYWFACVNTTLSQYMVPSLGAGNVVDNSLTSPSIKRKFDKHASSWPVAEFNEEEQSSINAAFASNPKPVHETQAKILLTQGLDRDSLRGAIPSSSQRESPSTVFGISTPGRPLNDPADDPTYITRVKDGTLTDADTKIQARKGGHTFVMDDGDYAGKTQVMRLRTAGGHQLLMNDSSQILYIANCNGTAWLEFTAAGHISMYSQTGINMRTEGEFNLHADKDININSKTNIKFRAGSSIAHQTVDYTIKSTNITLNASQIGVLSSGELKLQAASGSIKTGGDLVFKGGKIFLNTSTPADVTPVAPLTTNKHSDTSWDSTKGIWVSKAEVFESIATIAPAHEPWPRDAKIIKAPKIVEPVVKQSSVCAPQTPVQVPKNEIATAGLTNEAMLESYLRNNGVTDPIKLASIMAQCAHESGNWKYAKELGNDAYFAKYDAGTSIGKRLGNTTPGDGPKFKGRGFIQITGRYNYTSAGNSLGIDLANNPSLAEDPYTACKLVDWFFFTLNKSRTSNVDWANVSAVTRIVNGGLNGLSDREAKFATYKDKYMAGVVTSGGGSVVTDGSGNPITSGSSKDPGPDSAKGLPVQSPAPASEMAAATAPNPAAIAAANSSTPGLLSNQVKALLVEIGFAESGSNYSKIDEPQQRVGKYQINGLLLKEYGYTNSSKNLFTSSTWTGKDGVTSANGWLANTGVQDRVMEQIINDYYKTMTTQQSIRIGDDVCTVAGMLATAYFFRDFTMGVTAGSPTSMAKFWRDQATQTNKQGVSGKVPYNQGRYAIDVLSVLADIANTSQAAQDQPTAGDNTASGIDPDSVINFTKGSGDKDHYNLLGVSIRTAFEKMADEFKTKTGRKITLNSAVRTFEEQTKIYNAYNAAPNTGSKTKNVPGYGNISMPAKPSSNSPHVRGVAFDIAKADLQELIKLGLIDKYNFNFPFPVDDPVHIQFKA